MSKRFSFLIFSLFLLAHHSSAEAFFMCDQGNINIGSNFHKLYVYVDHFEFESILVNGMVTDQIKYAEYIMINNRKGGPQIDLDEENYSHASHGVLVCGPTNSQGGQICRLSAREGLLDVGHITIRRRNKDIFVRINEKTLNKDMNCSTVMDF